MDLFLKQQQKYVCVDTHTEHIIIHTSYTWVEKSKIVRTGQYGILYLLGSHRNAK